MKKRLITTILIIFDILLINLAFFCAFYLRFEGKIFGVGLGAEQFNTYIYNILIFTAIKIIVFYFFGLYKSLWKYASIEELVQVVTTSFAANAAIISYMVISQQVLPRSIYILAFMLDVIFIGGIRFSYRVARRFKEGGVYGLTKSKNIKRVMIVGAGQAGAMVIKELKNHEELRSKPVAVIDDSDAKLGLKINGVPVLGDRYHIRKIAERKKIDEIIIAIPSMKRANIREIVEECSKTNCKLKIVPGIFELIGGDISIQSIRDVEIEDLLGREAVKVDLEEISGYLTEKVVLVTGGGGSIGSELCRQISTFNPQKLLILDMYENNAYEIQNELIRTHCNVDLEIIMASVRDKTRLEEIFKKYKPAIVFHAAAHKHVPLMESNPKEAIKNNVFGTLNVAECAHKYSVEKFVLISTDKAVNPTNVMGATKRVAEMIVQSLNKVSKTEFVAVRFGNVLGSNGSVIPFFKKQIKDGGPVTVTHKDVTRYFMTIPEAVQLVIQAGAMAKGGEIFVLDMGKSVKIIDLARNLIRLSGFVPDEDIKIEIVGLRPGEKLFEELLLEGEGTESTKHEKIFTAKPLYSDLKQLISGLDILKTLLLGEDEKIVSEIAKIVPTYKRTK
ncbi:MAG: nucleoside-diphosphate sugar epimerase [Alkaliphilus sp.]|nr:polysaccharide biosynthesis protein [Alkaliphilus sp. AH-315-G20]MBN4067858.1 polysaccharide biosynthesis protein [Alkaliphilus transvaalensis]PHS29717.1 MAG: nucleoside-diphosphate sugar epimerase [Alkaliphilus sp.]